MTQITVAICTWNRCEILRQTLEQMTHLVVPGLQWSLIVADNNSNDDTAGVVESFVGRLPVRRIFEPRPGKSYAYNTLLREADGEFILWTDDDVLVDAHWLAAFFDATRRYPRGVVFGGPCEPWFPIKPDEDLVKAFPGLEAGFCAPGLPGPDSVIDFLRPADCIMGMNMGFRRAACDGLSFDPTLGQSPTSTKGGEEAAFISEVLRRGGEGIWVSGMRVRHYVMPSRMTLGYLTKYTFGLGQSVVHNQGIPPGARLSGAPRWLYRKCIESYLSYRMAGVLGNRLESLRALSQYWHLRGMIRECRSIAEASRRSQASRSTAS